jgi:hypothetical protein
MAREALSMASITIDENNKFNKKLKAARNSLSNLLDVLHLFINYIPNQINTSRHPERLLSEFILACDRVVVAIKAELKNLGIKPDQG